MYRPKCCLLPSILRLLRCSTKRSWPWPVDPPPSPDPSHSRDFRVEIDWLDIPQVHVSDRRAVRLRRGHRPPVRSALSWRRKSKRLTASTRVSARHAHFHIGTVCRRSACLAFDTSSRCPDPSKQCLKSPLRFDPETGCEDSHLDADEGVMFPDPRIASAQ